MKVSQHGPLKIVHHVKKDGFKVQPWWTGLVIPEVLSEQLTWHIVDNTNFVTSGVQEESVYRLQLEEVSAVVAMSGTESSRAMAHDAR